MKKRVKLSFLKGDFAAALLVILLAAAAGIWFWPNADEDGKRAELWLNGQLVQSIALDEDQTLELEGDYCSRITVRNGRVAVTESDCPGQDCVHSGWVFGAGHSIVCLPNRMEIRIVGEQKVDLILR